MAALGLGYGALQTGISCGTVFNALAIAGTAITAALALPLVTNATAGYVTEADLELLLSASMTTVAGAPNIQGFFALANSSTNYDQYAVSNSQLFPIVDTSFTFQLLPSTAYTAVIRIPRLILPRVASTTANPKLVLYNNSGVAFPATVTATLYPSGYDAG